MLAAAEQDHPQRPVVASNSHGADFMTNVLGLGFAPLLILHSVTLFSRRIVLEITAGSKLACGERFRRALALLAFFLILLLVLPSSSSKFA